MLAAVASGEVVSEVVGERLEAVFALRHQDERQPALGERRRTHVRYLPTRR